MKTSTIITRLKKQAENYGCIPEMADRIDAMFSPGSEYPRCEKCGRPYIVVDIAEPGTIYVGCPTDAHRDGDIQVRAWKK